MGASAPSFSMPRLMDLYNAHPRSVAQNRDKCVVCHTNADGSGKLSAFGHEYESGGLEFTESLMAEYANLFQPADPASPREPGAREVGVGAEPAPNPANDTDRGPVWSASAYFRAECQKCHGRLGDGDPLQGVPAWATKDWLESRSPRQDELVAIILEGKDKMVGHAGKISEAQAIELYRLIVEIARKNS